MEVNWHDKTNTYTQVSTKTVEIGKIYPLAGTIAALLWLILFSTAELASTGGQGLPKICITHQCPSPRKSLVKGERLIRHEERPE